MLVDMEESEDKEGSKKRFLAEATGLMAGPITELGEPEQKQILRRRNGT